MNLLLNSDLANGYKNASQKARILTEDWVSKEIFCPSCGLLIDKYDANKPVADFYCSKCVEDFELKSKQGKIGRRVSAGAYEKMIERISAKDKPNFFFMGYENLYKVKDFFIVPKHFFTTKIVEQRKPLKDTARRAGWIGSNILFSKIPKAGQIYYVEDGKVISKSDVLNKWNKTIFLKKIIKDEAKGWILDILNCIDEIGLKEFTLKDVYRFEDSLKSLHPENKHIKQKIRQQLQILRVKVIWILLGLVYIE